MKKALFPFVSILFADKTSFRFLGGVLFSFSFSISVILATLGIMDGFDFSLKKGLKHSQGDFLLSSRQGFFSFEENLEKSFQNLGIGVYSPLIQTEGFVLNNDEAKGVVVLGVDPLSFHQVAGPTFKLEQEDIALGEELAKQLKVQEGSEIVLALANGNQGFSSLPLLRRLKVSSLVKHRVYHKDLRTVYIRKSFLQNLLQIEDKINLVVFNLPPSQMGERGSFEEAPHEYLEKLSSFKDRLFNFLGPDFVIKLFWQEYAPLIEAVRIEKVSIGLILQLLIIISIFNVMAFVIYLNEKRSQEIFLIQALGASKKFVIKLWSALIFWIWILSCLISIGLTYFYDWLLASSSFLKLPGEVYHLDRLELKLEWHHFFTVFPLALVWVFLIMGFVLLKLRKRSILEGLRKEFS